MQTELTISTLEPALRWLNMAGLSVFAVSGALAAARQRLDIIAACFFAIVAAIFGLCCGSAWRETRTIQAGMVTHALGATLYRVFFQ